MDKTKNGKKTDSRDLKSKNWHAAEGKQRENEAACGSDS